MTTAVWGVVLAAGLSRRMGAPKQLLPFEGETLLARTQKVAAASRLAETLVVLSPEIAAKLAPRGRDAPPRVLNPDPASGESASLRLGLEALPPEATGALVLLADQPGVTPELADRLIRQHEREPERAIVPLYGGVRGAPVLLPRTLWPAASELAGDAGAAALVAAHPDLVRTVEVGHLGTPDDIDTPDQYVRLLAAREERDYRPLPSSLFRPGDGDE